ncbi:MAG: DUF1707 domain-containing protein [Propionibacteriaceae bacterium]|nr:DUF1707 domain-containing protein [Propionibacteriaceae bacterium]
MSSLPPSSKYLQQAGAAVDDTEREALTKRLSDAFADGRVGQDDYMAALDVIYAARQLGELVPVIEQLPAMAVEVPNLVQTSGASAGQVSTSRNILLPAVLITGAILLLLVILAVVGVLFVFPVFPG